MSTMILTVIAVYLVWYGMAMLCADLPEIFAASCVLSLHSLLFTSFYIYPCSYLHSYVYVIAFAEFEASHGTVTDLWMQHQNGEPTSFNPLGMAEALLSALDYAAELEEVQQKSAAPSPDSPVGDANGSKLTSIKHFTSLVRKALYDAYCNNECTKDMISDANNIANIQDGKNRGYLTTEEFVDRVAFRLGNYIASEESHTILNQDVLTLCQGDGKQIVQRKIPKKENVDRRRLKEIFDEFDTNKNGAIDINEFEDMMISLGIAPKIDPNKKYH